MARNSDTGAGLAATEPTARAAAEAFRVALPPLRPGEPPFEGPLDLILHLVKEHEVELFDIPIAKITEAYLATLDALRELDIDVAGEFLHMAAQLVLMKSKLLLPRTEVAEDAPSAEDSGVDPRAELVRRLLEYQKYKAAGEELGSRDILERSVFVRKGRRGSPTSRCSSSSRHSTARSRRRARSTRTRSSPTGSPSATRSPAWRTCSGSTGAPASTSCSPAPAAGTTAPRSSRRSSPSSRWRS